MRYSYDRSTVFPPAVKRTFMQVVERIKRGLDDPRQLRVKLSQNPYTLWLRLDMGLRYPIEHWLRWEGDFSSDLGRGPTSPERFVEAFLAKYRQEQAQAKLDVTSSLIESLNIVLSDMEGEEVYPAEVGSRGYIRGGYKPAVSDELEETYFKQAFERALRPYNDYVLRADVESNARGEVYFTIELA